MRALAVFVAILACACSSSSTGSMDQSVGGNGADMSGGASSDLAKGGGSDLAGGGSDGGNHPLCCNDPGNMGNSVGVGKYCNDSSMCGGGAPFCATLGDPTEHFCTTTCTMGSTACGQGASCQCQGGQCGCVPDVCVTPPPGC